MRYISSEKELKKISIYTNILEVENLISALFYKSEIIDWGDKINIAIIDSMDPFYIKKVQDSEIVFDITGGYPQQRTKEQRIYRGSGKENKKNVQVWLEFILSLFSIDDSRDQISFVDFFKEVEDYKKIDIKKYNLSKEILDDLENYKKSEISKKNNRRVIVFLTNGNIMFPLKEKETLKEGTLKKYGIKSFLKSSKLMFGQQKDILGRVFELEKK